MPNTDLPRGWETQDTHADDRIPVLEEENFLYQGADYTEQSAEQITDEILEVLNEEEGIVDEDTLLREAVVYEDEMGLENLENDFQDGYPDPDNQY